MKISTYFIKISVLVLWALLNTCYQLWGQDNQIDFEHIGLKHGLSNTTIFCIFQDSKGFLWFGTENGLNKYDGYQFKTYWHQPENPNSLGDKIVRTIAEDRYGILWIGTFGGGLDKYDPRKETFTHYRTDPGNPNSLSDNIVLTIIADEDDILWIGTFSGLNKFNRETETFTRYQANPGDPNSLSHNKVRKIYKDRSGSIWIGTLGGGLNRFSPETGEFTHYQAESANPYGLSNNIILSITEDNEGILWIGTAGGGLNALLPKTGIFTHFQFDPANPNSLSNNDVRDIFLDRSAVLWVGTTAGLNCYDAKMKGFVRYQSTPTNPDSLSVNAIQSIFEDKSGVLWIGTEFGGINKFNRENQKFNHYYHVANDPHSLSDNMVTAIYEDRGGVIWIGTYGGLNKWNRENDTFTNYRKIPHAITSLSSDRVWSIYEDHSGGFWIGTLDGLNYFDRKKEKFTHYLADTQDANSLSHNRILSIFEDREGYLWIGTYDGLNQFDRDKKVFKYYRNVPGDLTSISNNLIFSIFEDHYGALWIGTIEGLNKFNRKRETFTRFRADASKPDSISNDNITFIYEDRSGVLWLGTYGGLNKYDRKRNTFNHYQQKHGLPSDMILGILEDDEGNFWLSTDNGLSMFNIKTEEFKNYDISDGLQSNEFRYACCRSRRGEMFFGGINGFNAFFPGRITDNPFPPEVVITDFKISNKSVPIGPDEPRQTTLENHISATNEIKLFYKHTTLTFEYVGLHYAAPESNQYAYMMEGLEKEWNYVGNRRYAIYPYLSPGHYVFRVKASNNDNVWNETGASIRIYIPPPFWQQWWFIGLLGTAITLMLFGGYYYRTLMFRKKLAEQERLQKLLKQSRDEMKRARDIAEFRSAENEKLIAAISSIFITMDIDGKISQWNEPAEKFFGISREQLKDRFFVDVFTGFIPDNKIAEILETGLHQEKAASNIEVNVNFTNENESKLLLATINPIIDKSGKKFGFLLLAEDVTHQKIEQMRLLVSQKLEALGQMAAGIAHEIRSPLQYIGDNVRFLLETFGTLMESCVEINRSIKNAAQMDGDINLKGFMNSLIQTLQEKDFNFFIEEVPTALDHIVNGVTRVSNIVKSMIEFSHIGRDIYEKADLNEMLKTTLVVAHNRIKGIADLQTDYAPGLPPIYCCVGELNQVFLNLLINAADAIAETGKYGLIRISTKQKGSELIVEISDNGVGIPDQIKEKIYTPFFTTKKVGHGTGQGLPFSYSIVVEKHHGKLYFKHNADKGSTFFVHLPINEEVEESF